MYLRLLFPCVLTPYAPFTRIHDDPWQYELGWWSMGYTLMKPSQINTKWQSNELRPLPPNHLHHHPNRHSPPNCLGIETHLMTIEHRLYCPACHHSTFPSPMITAVGLCTRITFDNDTWTYLHLVWCPQDLIHSHSYRLALHRQQQQQQQYFKKNTKKHHKSNNKSRHLTLPLPPVIWLALSHFNCTVVSPMCCLWRPTRLSHQAETDDCSSCTPVLSLMMCKLRYKPTLPSMRIHIIVVIVIIILNSNYSKYVRWLVHLQSTWHTMWLSVI